MTKMILTKMVRLTKTTTKAAQNSHEKLISFEELDSQNFKFRRITK